MLTFVIEFRHELREVPSEIDASFDDQGVVDLHGDVVILAEGLFDVIAGIV